ncbi:MAG: hypothetical protein H0U54_16455 [Acidobacteria bacterium]|nr:hypothetical protein [Acidobacteriota bacterium]
MKRSTMKNSLIFLSLSLLLLTFVYTSLSTTVTHLEAAQNISQISKPLATESFNLTEEMEVGLEIEARSTGASWAREGAEAAALLISVDGVYQQDLLLWAGDELFPYRVMLGHLNRGKHTVSVTLNESRSAAEARRAEVKSLRPLPFAPARGAGSVDEDQLALAHSPFLYARANTIDRFTDIPLLMYYEILREAGSDLIVRYTAIFTNEDGGTQTAALMARWGRATDIEWVYQIRLRHRKIIEETYQGVEHKTKNFTGQRTAGSHPLLAVASDNNNFSDLACSSVRFAPLPVRARLETATRESVMDMYPQTYRVMTEELLREKRISETPTDINTIADPREYLYIEATSEQEGATLAFDVKVAGQPQTFASDMGEPRLRIDRSGYFRTAARLPRNVSPAAVETITARCAASSKPAGERRCKHLKVVRALMLDQNYVPRTLPLQTQPESSLAAGETKVFRLARP